MSDYEKFSDEEIVEKVRSNDQELYAILIERYQRKLTRYAMSILQDEYRAMNAVQDSFIKAFVHLNGFNVKIKFSSWIYRIVHNEVMNLVVKHKHEYPMFEDMDFESDEDIVDNFSKEEIKKRIHTCLSRMSQLYYEPMFLFFIEEKSYEEISTILRIPIGTVGTRINRAKILMKQLCQTIQQ